MARRCGTTACKGRPNQVGAITELVLGGRAWDVPMGRTAGRTRRGRGRAVIACAAGSVTHFPHLIATHLHLLTQLTCNSAVTLSRHRLTVATLANSPGCHVCALFFAHVIFFVATLYQRASLFLVSLTLTQFNSSYEHQRNEHLRIRCIRPLVPFLPYGRMHAYIRMYLRFNPFGLSQKQPQVTLSNLTH